MIKTLMGSIRDYMKVTIATPLLVLGEVICQMMIPFITADMIDAIKDGTAVTEMLPTAGLLVLIALTSLAFGAAAGITCSHASCGFARTCVATCSTRSRRSASPTSTSSRPPRSSRASPPTSTTCSRPL